MPALNKCCCCGLHQGALFVGNYAIIVYGTAMGITLWWIVEKEGDVPIPGYILLCLYFVTFFASILLVLSLAVQKKTSVLFGWLAAMAMFLIPECGLNMWICLFILGFGTTKGLGFLVFYLVRAIINVVCMICIHALYTTWKTEKAGMKERITNMYWHSLYGNSVPPFLMWHTPGARPPFPLPLPPTTSPLMLTYPGYESTYGGNPSRPPRKRPKMVSAGEKVEFKVEEASVSLPPSVGDEEATSLKHFPHDNDSPSHDSAFSSEHSGSSRQQLDRRMMDFAPHPPVLLPAPFRYPPPPPPPFAHPHPAQFPPPLSFPPPPPRPIPPPFLGHPVPPNVNPQHIYGARAPMGWSGPPGVGSHMAPRPLSTPTPAPRNQPTSTGPKIYEIVTVPRHKNPKPLPNENINTNQTEQSPGLENFMLKRTPGGLLQNYRPKSLHDLTDEASEIQMKSHQHRGRDKGHSHYAQSRRLPPPQHPHREGDTDTQKRYRHRTRSSPPVPHPHPASKKLHRPSQFYYHNSQESLLRKV